MVLNCIIGPVTRHCEFGRKRVVLRGPSRQQLCYFTPSASMLCVQIGKYCFFFLRPRALTNRRIEVVKPPATTLLATKSAQFLRARPFPALLAHTPR